MIQTLSQLRVEELNEEQANEARKLRARLSELSSALTKAVPLFEKVVTELSEVDSF